MLRNNLQALRKCTTI